MGIMKLHPTAEALATAERTYQRDKARAARSKAAFDEARKSRDAAVIAADTEQKTTAIAAEFGLTEGGVRRIRIRLQPKPKEE